MLVLQIIKHRRKLAALTLLATILVIIWPLYYGYKENVKTALLEEAIAYAKAISAFRSLYTSEVVQRLEDGDVVISHDYLSEHNSIPLPATLSIKLGESMIDNDSMKSVELYSPYPFPWRKETGGLRDQFAIDAWESINQNGKDFWRIEEYDEKEVLRYAVADKMRVSCVSCHNNHPQTPKTGWQVGDVRGILEVRKSVSKVSDTVVSSTIKTGAYILVLVVALVGFILYIISKLEDAILLADQKNADLADFAHTVSHELKAPLDSINSLSTMLPTMIKNEISSDAAQLFEMMQTSTKKMTQLVYGILEFSSAGEHVKLNDEVDLNVTLKEVINELNVSDDVNIEISRDLPVLWSNQLMIHQLFFNLLSNAVKYSDKPETLISIDCKIEADYYHISVKDNGPGIEVKNENDIFKLFAKQGKLKEGYESTGIGLSIVKKIVDAFKGKIRFESELNVGSVFIVSLPKPK